MPYGAYWLVSPEGDNADPAAKAFTDWLKAELAADLARNPDL
jgi:hypothetical protein